MSVRVHTTSQSQLAIVQVYVVRASRFYVVFTLCGVHVHTYTHTHRAHEHTIGIFDMQKERGARACVRCMRCVSRIAHSTRAMRDV